MDMLLDKIDFSSVYGAVTCCDVFCDDSTHKTSCDTLWDQPISACLNASEATFPLSRSIAHVERAHKATAGRFPIFWPWLWKEAGRPAAGALAPIQWKGQLKYLGNIISCDLSDAYDIKANTNVFISQVNIYIYIIGNLDTGNETGSGT